MGKFRFFWKSTIFLIKWSFKLIVQGLCASLQIREGLAGGLRGTSSLLKGPQDNRGLLLNNCFLCLPLKEERKGRLKGLQKDLIKSYSNKMSFILWLTILTGIITGLRYNVIHLNIIIQQTEDCKHFQGQTRYIVIQCEITLSYLFSKGYKDCLKARAAIISVIRWEVGSSK